MRKQLWFACVLAPMMWMEGKGGTLTNTDGPARRFKSCFGLFSWRFCGSPAFARYPIRGKREEGMAGVGDISWRTLANSPNRAQLHHSSPSTYISSPHHNLHPQLMNSP